MTYSSNFSYLQICLSVSPKYSVDELLCARVVAHKTFIKLNSFEDLFFPIISAVLDEFKKHENLKTRDYYSKKKMYIKPSNESCIAICRLCIEFLCESRSLQEKLLFRTVVSQTDVRALQSTIHQLVQTQDAQPLGRCK